MSPNARTRRRAREARLCYPCKTVWKQKNGFQLNKRELKPADLERIDLCLMSYISDQYSKVAFIIAQAMLELHTEYPALPDMFYASRIEHLASTGVIEPAGNLDRIRFSEVRLRNIDSHHTD
jgi:hypothetical protein